MKRQSSIRCAKALFLIERTPTGSGGHNHLLIVPSELQLIGQSATLRDLNQQIDLAARSDAKVLITGETGVGKEVLARLIHHRSPRARAPIVTINCAGLPDELLESELFGHTRGSFTDAHRDTIGLVERAPHGTLFLDEVGEMSPRMQAVLLRFLESGEVQRVGEELPRKVANVRIITATNRDLGAHVASGRFREDLYFRLNVIGIDIAPLRDRAGDIPLFVDHFFSHFARAHGLVPHTASASALSALVAYRWPGNVRELKNVVERMVVARKGAEVQFEHLPVELRLTGLASAPPVPGTAPAALDEDTRLGTALDAMVAGGESFWSAVHAPYMSRDLTRSDLRRIVHIGLGRSGADYRRLLGLFNMPASDHRRFLSFLRGHHCHIPAIAVGRVPSPTIPIRAERL